MNNIFLKIIKMSIIMFLIIIITACQVIEKDSIGEGVDLKNAEYRCQKIFDVDFDNSRKLKEE